jgi:integrase
MGRIAELKSNQLTARKVETALQPGYYGDGGGLYLQVSKKYGTRNWVFRFMLNGRAREMGLGSPQTFTLKEARERARRCRQFVADGIDPIEERKRRRDEANAETSGQMLFKDAVKRFLEVHETTWKNAKHRQQWANTLRDYARTLRDRPISAIDGAQITEALSPIWTKKPETARRTKQRIERVRQWVKDGMPLPLKGVSKRVRHHPALPFTELPAFMSDLRERDSVSARALEFTILTAARTSETIGAKWSEIDLDEAVWTVPADRMKAGKEHEVPLSKRALSVLKDLPREHGGYVFMGAKAKSPLSNMAMLELLRGMNGSGLTVHGFRSTFRDWAGDRTNFARDVIEHALAHKIKDKAEAAYRRSAALEKRRKLMEAWAQYCSTTVESGKVVALHG